MGFGDKLKGLRDQAQQAVAENKDKIQDAVQVVGDAANTKTHGKYANKIAKVGMKVEQGVDKIAAEGAEAEGAPVAGTAPTGEAAPAPETAPASEAAPAPETAPASEAAPAPAPAAPAADKPASGFPEFS